MTMKLPEELQMKVENMTPMQRAYCEYRAKGLTQSAAAAKAGSSASDNAARSRVGYQIEQMDGTKEYINFLQQQRAAMSGLDEVAVINMIKQVYDEAMRNDKFKEANTAVELLGKAIGLFNKPVSTKESTSKDTQAVEAFTEDLDPEDNRTNERINKLQQMLKDLNKS